MKDLKVSIVIPTYNRPLSLDRLLKSVAKQTFNNYEVIVVDDGSTNISEYTNVIRKYKTQFKEFKYIKNKANLGANHCRNKGISISKYSLVALIDDDDEWLPRKLELQVNIFKKNWENTELVYSWTIVKDETGNILFLNKPITIGNAFPEILKNCSPIGNPSGVIIKKSCLYKLGLFDENLPCCQDWDLWIRFFKMGFRCLPTKKLLTIYYVHKKGLTKSSKVSSGYIKFALKHFWSYIRYSPFTLFILAFRSLSRKLGISPRDMFKALIISFKKTLTKIK